MGEIRPEARARVKEARQAVKTFYGLREELPEFDDVLETVEAISETSSEARAENRKMTDAEWLDLAEMVDDACEAAGLPLLFDPSSRIL